MIKCKTIKEFTLKKFNELKNIERANEVYVEGKLQVGDTFECEKDMADYLLGNNAKKEVVIEIIEVIPEKQETKKKETEKQEITQKPKKKTTKKKSK